MKSRRRMAFPTAYDHANRIDDYSRDLRLAKWGSGVSLHDSNPETFMSAFKGKADAKFGNRILLLTPIIKRLPTKGAYRR